MFIDAANIFYSQRTLGWRIDYTKLKHYLERETNLVALHVLKSIDAYEVCILMSGDSDFAPLIDELKARGKRVFVMSAKHHVSRELIERAKYINLRKLEADISYKNDPPDREAGERSDARDII